MYSIKNKKQANFYRKGKIIFKYYLTCKPCVSVLCIYFCFWTLRLGLEPLIKSNSWCSERWSNLRKITQHWKLGRWRVQISRWRKDGEKENDWEVDIIEAPSSGEGARWGRGQVPNSASGRAVKPGKERWETEGFSNAHVLSEEVRQWPWTMVNITWAATRDPRGPARAPLQ